MIYFFVMNFHHSPCYGSMNLKKINNFHGVSNMYVEKPIIITQTGKNLQNLSDHSHSYLQSAKKNYRLVEKEGVA